MSNVDIDEVENEEERDLDEFAELLGSVVGVEPPQNWVRAVPGRRMAMGSRSPEIQRKVYEQELGRISGRVEQVKSDLRAKAYGEPVPPDVAGPIRLMLAAEKQAGEFATRANYLDANRQLSALTQALSEAEQAGEVAKAVVAVRALIKTTDEGLFREASEHKAVKFMAPAVAGWRDRKQRVEQRLGEGNLDLHTVDFDLKSAEIKGGINFLKFTLKIDFPRNLKERQEAIGKVREAIEYANQFADTDMGGVESWSTLWSKYEEARDDALNKASALAVDYDFEKIDASNEELHKAVANLAPGVAGKVASQVSAMKTSDFRSEFESRLGEMPKFVLTELGKLPDWNDKVDAMVRSVGSKATTSEEKKVVTLAIESRYGLTLSGEFSAKNLVKLYGILKMVPKEHVKSDSLKDIRCHKFDDDYVAGDYSSTEKRIRIGSEMSGDGFKRTTLHEVGHAVDDHKDVMKNGGPDEYGKWHEETVETVAAAIYEHFKSEIGDEAMYSTNINGIIKLIAPPSSSELKAYLAAVLGGNDTPDLPDDEDDMKKFKLNAHESVRICKAIRVANKHWDQGNAGAARNKIGDRVYQEAYSGTWVSYEHSQRAASRIRDYTFRAPGEWFADAYAHFYQGKLNKKHPAYEYLFQDKASLK